MPNTAFAWTQAESGAAQSITSTSSSAGNSTTTTFRQATIILNAQASTNITYSTTGYASGGGGPAMQYSLHIIVEGL
jgi:hypothetical protein